MSLLILVVDDEPDVEVLFRQQFRRDLRDSRFTMEFAQSAPAALQCISNAGSVSLILILSDINMPGMSGLELLPKAKALRPDVQVETEFGEKYVITRDSIDRHIAQIREALAAAGRAPTRLDAPERLLQARDISSVKQAALLGAQSRLDAPGRDYQTVYTEHLEKENAFLREQNTVLLERFGRDSQRPYPPHQQAGHVTAPDQCSSNVKIALAMAPSTRDPKRTFTSARTSAPGRRRQACQRAALR
jgi:CheY-like chemotaxis protein